MIQKVNVSDFLALAQQHAVLDVRSPGEYAHAHIPGAYNLPLFTDDERKVVGTAYKQQSRERAIKEGLNFFGTKMTKMVEGAEAIIEARRKSSGRSHADNILLVHCWRGGMRSAGVAWLLDLYGYKVYTLAGGYKTFRNHVLPQFEKEYLIHIIGGYTGSGKTQLLHELRRNGHVTVDLEAIAHHKGSAFGGLGQAPQPTAEMFENKLALALMAAGAADTTAPIWIEDESRRIGDINMPNAFWQVMRRSPVYFLEVPFEERLEHIVQEYGKHKKEQLVNSIIRIQKRLGGLATKNAINYLLEDNYKECFAILLRYYDKFYAHDLLDRADAQLLHRVACTSADAKMNMQHLMNKTVTALWKQRK